MGDLPKRKYPAATDRLHADIELALKRQSDDVDGLTAYDIAYTPADPSKWSTVPSTVGQALDLIAANLNPV